jgi:hypothetical protein
MSECSRRDFSTRLAASMSATLVAGQALGDDAPAKAAAAENSPSDAKAPGTTIDDHQLAVLLERYPAPHFTPEIIEGVRSGLAHNRRLAERIRQTALPFDTEPAFQFRVWRGDNRGIQADS